MSDVKTEDLLNRIPNLPTGPIVDKNGMPTDDEWDFRQILITALQKNIGSEGLVAPTQTNDTTNLDLFLRNHIKDIQDAQLPNPITGQLPGAYTCQFGTFLYDATNNRILVAIDGGGGVPAFKEVVLVPPVPPI